MKTLKMFTILVVLGLMLCPANGELTLPYYGTTSTNGKAFWVSNTYPGSGLTYGGFFYAAGIYGRGVFGQSDGSSGMGVKGWAQNSGDVENFGGHFTSAGERGIGVYGWAENTGNVQNYGGFFLAEGNRGIGLFAMGGPNGVAGEFAGDIMITGNGNGIVFPDGTKQTTAGTGGGGGDGADADWVISENNMYCGVSGNVGIGTASPKAGLHINRADSWGSLTINNKNMTYDETHFDYPDGKNYIRGTTILADTGGNVGIGTTSPSPFKLYVTGGSVRIDNRMHVNGPDGPWACAIKASAGYGQYSCGGIFYSKVSGSGIGVWSHGSRWDFYADNGDYGPFTGGHEVKLNDSFPADVESGMIVSVTGQTQTRYKDNGGVQISSTLPTVKLSDMANDKAVFGVFVAEGPLDPNHWYEISESERFAKVNALGEGRVWICNINGEIESGDYITTSTVPGYGQRQDDDLLHSYTLGKAIETIDWDSVTETIDFNDQKYKAYLIAVVYTSG